MGYRYDLFVSYAHDKKGGEKLIEQWLDMAFLPYFETHLENALGKKVKIFKDDEEILTGQNWPNRLKDGILYSKYLLAILTPSYFVSEWCSKECYVILERMKRLKKQGKNGQGLILPIGLSDPETFPDELKDIQVFDCTDYFFCAKKYPETPAFLEFEIELKKWVKKIAPLIKNAPEWDTTWEELSKIKFPKTLIEENDKEFNLLGME